MTVSSPPLLLEPSELEARLGAPGWLVVDLRKAEDYARGHIPGAVHLDRSEIVAKRPPVGGLLPTEEALGRALGGIGVTPETAVVAYDDEGGGWAGRLLWTLDVLGHPRASLLDGGWVAWSNEGYPIESRPVEPRAVDGSVVITGHGHADAAYILGNLGRADLALLDTRTPEEFSGVKRLADRGGHIPGAVNMDWLLAMDPGRNLRLKPESELRAQLRRIGVIPEREVIVYCQTHHRSSHTYIMLKSLGYPRVRGYPGAWSDWGNRADTPVEV